MKLNSQRLDLLELCFEDLQDIHQLHSLPEVDEFNTLGIPESIDITSNLISDWIEQQNIVPRSSHIFSIKLINTNEFIGLIALNLGKPKYKSGEVWYKLLPAYWNNGYATEALTAIVNFGFVHLTLHRIEAGCAVDNAASIRVLEKVGMLNEGRSREILPIRGKWVDNYRYAILSSDLNN